MGLLPEQRLRREILLQRQESTCLSPRPVWRHDWRPNHQEQTILFRILRGSEARHAGDGVHCPAGATTEFIRDPVSGNITTGLGVTNVVPPALRDSIASKIATGSYWPQPTISALINHL